jgi:hypothetical protein
MPLLHQRPFNFPASPVAGLPTSHDTMLCWTTQRRETAREVLLDENARCLCVCADPALHCSRLPHTSLGSKNYCPGFKRLPRGKRSVPVLLNFPVAAQIPLRSHVLPN